jgi:antitoxin (DNA-binding transcriptional repressor) of toxin-antitoxin stability system
MSFFTNGMSYMFGSDHRGPGVVVDGPQRDIIPIGGWSATSAGEDRRGYALGNSFLIQRLPALGGAQAVRHEGAALALLAAALGAHDAAPGAAPLTVENLEDLLREGAVDASHFKSLCARVKAGESIALAEGGEAVAVVRPAVVHPATQAGGFVSEARRLAPGMPTAVLDKYAEFVAFLQSAHGLGAGPAEGGGTDDTAAPFCDDTGPELFVLATDTQVVLDRAREEPAALLGWRVEVKSPASPKKAAGKRGVVEGIAKARVGKPTGHVFRPDDQDTTATLVLDRKGRSTPKYWKFELLEPPLGSADAQLRLLPELPGPAWMAPRGWAKANWRSCAMRGPCAAAGPHAGEVAVDDALLAAAQSDRALLEELVRDQGLMLWFHARRVILFERGGPEGAFPLLLAYMKWIVDGAAPLGPPRA